MLVGTLSWLLCTHESRYIVYNIRKLKSFAFWWCLCLSPGTEVYDNVFYRQYLEKHIQIVVKGMMHHEQLLKLLPHLSEIKSKVDVIVLVWSDEMLLS